MFSIYSSRGAAVLFKLAVPASAPEPEPEPVTSAGAIGITAAGEIVALINCNGVRLGVMATGELVALVESPVTVGIRATGELVAIV
jgi:hypothetical protein